LFVHGTRDGFGTINEMTQALNLIPAPTRLLLIDRAGHELLSKTNANTLVPTILDDFLGWPMRHFSGTL
jgi:predicted alpha/beta-hydrolase family hydrolase